ncbi:MAG TPA: response regulator [Bryobacteraceae bacterium]|nr:response regulator [Bryobacteraceae bacterium]
MTDQSILIVDDTPVNLKLTRLLLEREGFEVRTAASAEEALEVLESFRPRLVLADIQLPGIDGLEMTRRIKADPRHRDVLVVALTAYAMKGDEERAREAGCDGYITKPIDTRRFGQRLREYLGEKAGEQAQIMDPPPLHVAQEDISALRLRFLTEGLRQLHQWREELPGQLDPLTTGTSAHQWVGAGALLGFPEISVQAREVEHLLREKPVDLGQLLETLEELEREFSHPTAADAGPAAASAASPAARVLLAAESPDSLAMIKAILESQSVECLIAADGPSALQSIERERPDAAVLHARLPQMSGYEVLGAIQERALPVKVLLLASDGRPEAAGADDSLPEPFQPFEPVLRLNRLLSNKLLKTHLEP